VYNQRKAGRRLMAFRRRGSSFYRGVGRLLVDTALERRNSKEE